MTAAKRGSFRLCAERLLVLLSSFAFINFESFENTENTFCIHTNCEQVIISSAVTYWRLDSSNFTCILFCIFNTILANEITVQ